MKSALFWYNYVMKDRMQKLLREYGGNQIVRQLCHLAEQVDPEGYSEDIAVVTLMNFVEGDLRRTLQDIDHETLGEIRAELRAYFSDLGLFNLPRFWVEKSDRRG